MRHRNPLSKAFEDELENYSDRMHHHDVHQLIYAVSGVVKIDTNGAIWTLPRGRAAWIRAGIDHAFETAGATVRTVYFPEDIGKSPARHAVFEFPALGRELVAEMVRAKRDDIFVEDVRNLLFGYLSDRWVNPIWELYQPTPVTPEVTTAMKSAWEDLTIDLKGASDAASCSPRTLSRRFQDDVGITWREFLLQSRMIRALELLSEEMSVTDTCHSVGYSSLGAFSNTFQDYFGFRPSEARDR